MVVLEVYMQARHGERWQGAAAATAATTSSGPSAPSVIASASQRAHFQMQAYKCLQNYVQQPH
jgi:hypothetical protein